MLTLVECKKCAKDIEDVAQASMNETFQQIIHHALHEDLYQASASYVADSIAKLTPEQLDLLQLAVDVRTVMVSLESK